MSKPRETPTLQDETSPASSIHIDANGHWQSELAKKLTNAHMISTDWRAWAKLLDFKVEMIEAKKVPLAQNMSFIVNGNVIFLKAARSSASRKSEWHEIAPSLKSIEIISQTEHEKFRAESQYFYWMNYCLSWMRLTQIYTKVLDHKKREIPKFLSDVCTIARLPLKASTAQNLPKWSEEEWEGEWDFGQRIKRRPPVHKYPSLYRRAEQHTLTLHREMCASQMLSSG